MSKTITLRVESKVYQLLLARAKSERRPLSNYIEVAALLYSTHSEFADDSEMAEIMADKKLVKRLKEGSKDAKAMKGKFVEWI